MITPALEEQLLRLPPADKLHLIQLLAQSLNTVWNQDPQLTSDKLSHFFRQSPLCQEVSPGELDLSRDRTLPRDRFTP